MEGFLNIYTLTPRHMYFKFTAILPFFTLFIPSLFGQIYVNQSATGANDGSSWENAFTDLQSALTLDTEETQIWVAAGVYHPGEAGDSLATFHVTRDIQLYGSFQGTEQELADRSLEFGLSTTLSGDILGNDQPEDFETNKQDNVFNVLHIDSGVVNQTIIDGFTIRGGHANGNFEVSNRHGRGGGVYCEGAPIFQNCVLLENYALSDGGGIFLDSISGEGPQLYDCTIKSNASGDDGGGIEATHITGEPLLLVGIALSGNKSQEVGGGMHVKSSNVLIRGGAAFDNRSETFGGGLHLEYLSGDNGLQTDIRNFLIRTNIASDRGGGMVFYAEDSLNTLVLDSVEFIENRTRTSGGGLYAEFRGNYTQTTFQISHTTFEGNLAPLEHGGAMYIRSSSLSSAIQLDSLVFRDNFAALRGGGIYTDFSENGPHALSLAETDFAKNAAETGGAIDMNTRNRSVGELFLERTAFTENEASSLRGEGGAINIRAGGEDFRGTFWEVNFLENEALNGGGVNLEVAPSRKGSFQFREVQWQRNRGVEGERSPSRGGALYAASDGGDLALEIHGSAIVDNSASLGGGLLVEAQTGASANVAIDSTLFFLNRASNSAGGLLYLISDEFSRGQLAMYAGEFRENSASENVGGMALSIGSDNFTGRISHSRFTQNSSPNYAALFVQRPASQDTDARFFLSNSLVARNTSPEGAVSGSFSFPMNLTNCTLAENEGIGIEIADRSELSLQNTLLYNPGYANVQVEDELAQILSEGGNLSGDTSLDAVFGEEDLSNTEPLFIGGTYAPYRLENGSPGIDAGVLPDSLSPVDVIGAPRLVGSAVDIGAYEGSFAVSTPPLLAPVNWTLFPNPAATTLFIRGDNLEGKRLEIWDVWGKRLHFLPQLPIGTPTELAIANFPTGLYKVIIGEGKSRFVGTFLKN